jgi:glycosyltransferase involved in cell wall biosynthesis
MRESDVLYPVHAGSFLESKIASTGREMNRSQVGNRGASPLTREEDGLLLVLPVPFQRQEDGTLWCEEQAANGLDQWAENFSHVTVIAPVIGRESDPKGGTVRWSNPAKLCNFGRLELVPLPLAYSPLAFLAALGRGRRVLIEHIERNRYLQFCVGGLFGDWAAVGALIAKSRKLPYSVHTDRVEHEVMVAVARNGPALRRFKAKATARLAKSYHRLIISGCSLGLWHGKDCFLAYSQWAKENHLIHDIHLKPEDAISPEQLIAKLRCAGDGPLRIAYAGRMDPMKAPLDWLRSLRSAIDRGVDFEAVWLGDGPLASEFRALKEELGLTHVVRTPGFVDRPTLLLELRQADVFVFTHITPESPRCLLEALVCGTPILGYFNSFAEDILSEGGGGSLVPVGDWQMLGEQVAEVHADPVRLKSMILDAASNGRRFNDGAVFRERSELIRTYS